MKKLGILVLACITALNLWAEEFKIGKLTFEIETPTTVGLIHADEDITKLFLSETIDYEGNSYTLTYIGDGAFSYCTGLQKLNFTGTKKQWENITKNTHWKYMSSIKTIVCSDKKVKAK